MVVIRLKPFTGLAAGVADRLTNGFADRLANRLAGRTTAIARATLGGEALARIITAWAVIAAAACTGIAGSNRTGNNGQNDCELFHG